LHVAERLLHRLPERDADVLGGVVMVDMQVALGVHRDVDARVARQQVEHVIEEADAGRNRRAAGAVEVDLDRDVGLLGLALYRRGAHVEPLEIARLLTGVWRPGYPLNIPARAAATASSPARTRSPAGRSAAGRDSP